MDQFLQQPNSEKIPSELVHFYSTLEYFPCLYHIIVFKNAFKKLPLNVLSIIKISKLFNDEHVHIIAYSLKILKSSIGIRFEKILTPFPTKKITLYYFDEHDTYCDYYQDIPSLEYLTMNTILQALWYLDDIQKLPVACYLKKQLYAQNENIHILPKFNNFYFSCLCL